MDRRPIIRLCKESEAEQLSRISREVFPLACPEHSSPIELKKYIDANLSSTDFQRLISSPGYFLWLARLGDQPAGFCMLRANEDGIHELSKLYVLPDFHGKGIGKALVGKAVEKAQHLGGRKIELTVYCRNEKAKQLYRRFGFAFARKTQFEMGAELHDDEIFEKVL